MKHSKVTHEKYYVDEAGVNLAAKASDLIKGILRGAKPKEESQVVM